MTKELTPEHTIEMLQRERDSLRDRVEGLRWMVDQMNKDSEAIIYDSENHGPVYAAIAYTWGPKCDVYEPGCPCCAAWEEYDGSTALRAENERLREWNREIALNARELVAENERLRAALEEILSVPRDANKSYAELFVEVRSEIRAALDGQPALGKEEV